MLLDLTNATKLSMFDKEYLNQLTTVSDNPTNVCSASVYQKLLCKFILTLLLSSLVSVA